jgi:hypothetical protein
LLTKLVWQIKSYRLYRNVQILFLKTLNAILQEQFDKATVAAVEQVSTPKHEDTDVYGLHPLVNVLIRQSPYFHGTK